MSDLRWHVANHGTPLAPLYELVAVVEDSDDHLPTVDVPDHVVAGVRHADLIFRAWQDRLAELHEKQTKDRRK